MVLRDIEDEFVARVDELAHQFHCSLAQPNGMEGDEDRAAHHVKEARNAFNDIGKLLLPWYKQWEEEGETLAKQWRDFKLRERDPAYAAYLKKQRGRVNQIAEDNKQNLQVMTDLKLRLRERNKKKFLEIRRRKHAGFPR